MRCWFYSRPTVIATRDEKTRPINNFTTVWPSSSRNRFSIAIIYFVYFENYPPTTGVKFRLGQLVRVSIRKVSRRYVRRYKINKDQCDNVKVKRIHTPRAQQFGRAEIRVERVVSYRFGGGHGINPDGKAVKFCGDTIGCRRKTPGP